MLATARYALGGGGAKCLMWGTLRAPSSLSSLRRRASTGRVQAVLDNDRRWLAASLAMVSGELGLQTVRRRLGCFALLP